MNAPADTPRGIESADHGAGTARPVLEGRGVGVSARGMPPPCSVPLPRSSRGSRGIPCSGRCCPSSAVEIVQILGLEVDAVTAMPGVQNPHWKPKASTSACCTGCSASPAASPAAVVTADRPRRAAGTMQECTGSPSSRTEHAPQSRRRSPSSPRRGRLAQERAQHLARARVASTCAPLTSNLTTPPRSAPRHAVLRRVRC